MGNNSSLTDAAIRNLKPLSSQQFEVWDQAISGFGLRISPSGTKAFVLVYRLGGKPKRITLGRYPDLSLAKARAAAYSAKSKIAVGHDPKPEKPKAHSRRTEHTFSLAVDNYIERHAKRKNKTWKQTEQMIHREFIKTFADTDIREISKHDIARLIEQIVARGSPASANLALRIIKKFFNWSVEQGLLEISPVNGLKAPAKITSRDRVLSETEIAVIWKSADTVGYPYGQIVKLLLLTGQRRGEVVGMRWDELNLEVSHWSISSERTKNGKPNEVPLSATAKAIITNLPIWKSEFVFPARGNPESIFSGFSKLKQKLDKEAKISDWRLHDLRRTLATGLAKIGTDPHVVEHILNHQTGTLSQVARIYNRYSYADEKQEALQMWAEHVDKFIRLHMTTPCVAFLDPQGPQTDAA